MQMRLRPIVAGLRGGFFQHTEVYRLKQGPLYRLWWLGERALRDFDAYCHLVCSSEFQMLMALAEAGKVMIQDRPCGFGKTTSMIEGFTPAGKYLVITPLLSEVDRIIEESSVEFVQPVVDGDFATKRESLMALLADGKNIATTHALFTSIVDAADQAPELFEGYEVIIDEVLSVLRDLAGHRSLNKGTFQEFYVDTGYVTISDSGLVQTTPKWDNSYEDVKAVLKRDLYEEARTGCLYYINETFFLWVMPEKLVTSGLNVTIYTFLAHGSLMSEWLKKFGVSTVRRHDPKEHSYFKKLLRENLTVKTIPALERLRFSASGQSTRRMTAAQRKKVAQTLNNLRARELKGVPAEDIMITCAKDNWYDNPATEKGTGAFAKGTSLFKANWVANTTRGTNQYINCSHAIYLWDQHPNPGFLQWLGVDDPKQFEKDYALSELIQWLMRTRLRDKDAKDRSVTLYLPSKRMRDILEEYMWEGQQRTQEAA